MSGAWAVFSAACSFFSAFASASAFALMESLTAFTASVMAFPSFDLMAFSNTVRVLSSCTLPFESSRTLVASSMVLSSFEAFTASALPLTSLTVFAYTSVVLSSRAVTARMPFRFPDGHPGISVFVFEAVFTVEANVPTVFASLTSDPLTAIAVFKASDFRYSVSFPCAFTALSYATEHSPDASVRRPWLHHRYPPVPPAASTTAHPPAITGTSHFGFEAARAAPDGSVGGWGTGFDPLMLCSSFMFPLRARW